MIRIRLSGIALYKKSTRSVAPLSLPHRGRGTAERRSGAFVNRRLETLLPTLFHTACALSAPSGHLPLEGKADDTRKTCDQQTFGHRPINICGEAAA